MLSEKVKELRAALRARGWTANQSLDLALRFIAQNAEADEFVDWIDAIGATGVLPDGPARPDYAFRYVDEEGEPLRDCPGCANPLTESGDGVVIEFVRGNGSTTWREPSHLDDEGNLVDLGAIARGFHLATLCGLCNEALKDFDDVVTEIPTGRINARKER
jgi:hypothetical protein